MSSQIPVKRRLLAATSSIEGIVLKKYDCILIKT